MQSVLLKKRSLFWNWRKPELFHWVLWFELGHSRKENTVLKTLTSRNLLSISYLHWKKLAILFALKWRGGWCFSIFYYFDLWLLNRRGERNKGRKSLSYRRACATPRSFWQEMQTSCSAAVSIAAAPGGSSTHRDLPVLLTEDQDVS